MLVCNKTAIHLLRSKGPGLEKGMYGEETDGHCHVSWPGNGFKIQGEDPTLQLLSIGEDNRQNDANLAAKALLAGMLGNGLDCE